MSLVFAGACSHGPGITGRAHLAEVSVRAASHAEFRAMGEALAAAKPTRWSSSLPSTRELLQNNMPPIDGHGDPTKGRSRPGWSASPAPRAGKRRAVAAPGARRDAGRGSGLRRGMEVRPRVMVPLQFLRRSTTCPSFQ